MIFQSVMTVINHTHLSSTDHQEEWFSKTVVQVIDIENVWTPQAMKAIYPFFFFFFFFFFLFLSSYVDISPSTFWKGLQMS